MELAEACYRLSRSFPKAEEYRLTSQLLRAATSVAANIAEGNGRESRRDYARFISIARGSIAETETLLILASRIGLATTAEIEPVIMRAERVARMLNGLHRSLEADPAPSS